MNNHFKIKQTVVIISLVMTTLSEATKFSADISFDEIAFSTFNTAINSPISYNILNDLTGTELTTLNADLDDITIHTSSTGEGSIDYRTTSSGSFRLDHSFTGSPVSNNLGTRIENQFELNFSSHLTVTDFSFDVNSANTAGLAWEVTTFQLLDSNGNVFSAVPKINPYLSHTEINGLAGTGTYVLDSKATILDVGTDQVSSGVSNSNENFTVTGDLGYIDFGLAENTEISGLLVTTFLEDTRGVSNGDTNFSSSIIDFSFSGDIKAVPEPSTTLLYTLGASFLLFRKKRV